MKKLILSFTVLCTLSAAAQVQYGGQIRALNNAGVIAPIGRTNDHLKTTDSVLNLKVPQLTLIGTALKTDGSTVTQPVSLATVPSHPVTNAGTFAVQATISGTVPISGGLTDAQIRATALPVSGTISTGLSQPLTDAQLRAVAVPVSGTFFQATQPVSGPITDAQIRASAIQVAGTRPNSGASAVGGSSHLTVGGSDGTNLRPILLDATGRASVIGTFFQATQPVSIATHADNTATGTLTAAAQTVVLTMGGKSAVGIVITGTWAGTITFEGSVDGTNWNAINAVAASTSAPQSTTTVNGLFRLTPAGLLQARVIMTAFTSGTATVTMRAATGTGGVFANQILPSRITDGTSTVAIKAASTAAAAADMPMVVALHPSSPTPNFLAAQAVTGTFFQATQPVSLATNTPVIAAGANAIGNINELRAATLTVTATSATGVAATLTIPAVAAQFHYITSIDISIYATAARVGAATPVVVTTTNIAGSPAFTFETAQAIGTNTPIQGYNLTTPLKSAVINTATTIVAPIAVTGIWRITVTYFTAP